MVMAIFSPRFADTAVRVSATAMPAYRGRRPRAFRAGSRQAGLRRKGFGLLPLGPWLVSQSLMQQLYPVPPAPLVWRSVADESVAAVLRRPAAVYAPAQPP